MYVIMLPKTKKSRPQLIVFELYNTLILAQITVSAKMKSPVSTIPPNLPSELEFFPASTKYAKSKMRKLYQKASKIHLMKILMLKCKLRIPYLYRSGSVISRSFVYSRSIVANHMIGKAVKATL